MRRFALTSLLFCWSAANAAALTVSDTNPLFFPLGGTDAGFDPAAVASSGRTSSFTATDQTQRLCAGVTGTFEARGACAGESSFSLTITQNLVQVHQNPQAAARLPNPTSPFIADSLWTITNTSGQDFGADLALLFTNVDLTNFPSNLLFPYPDVQTGLDVGAAGAPLLDIVRDTSDAMDALYGAAMLGELDPGQSKTVRVRYLVNGPLATSGGFLIMPPLAVEGFVVPEPTTLLLLGSGLLGLAAARRSNRWS